MISLNDLVLRAIASLHLYRLILGASDLETGWSLAVAWREQTVFESTYVRAAWRALALALAAGDEAAALDAALWLAEPGLAMERAMARVRRESPAAEVRA